METKLKELLISLLEIPEDTYSLSLTMEDLSRWDSLKHMELITSLEKAFSIECTIGEIVSMRSIGKIHEVVLSKVS